MLGNIWHRVVGSSIVDMGISSNNMKSPSPKYYIAQCGMTIYREKVRDLTQSYEKTPFTQRKIPKANAIKNFDYATIADRLQQMTLNLGLTFVLTVSSPEYQQSPHWCGLTSLRTLNSDIFHWSDISLIESLLHNYTLSPTELITEFWEVSMDQRMRLANRGRLLLCISSLVPFVTSVCCNVETRLS